jgi:hypothetical protein
MNEIFSFIMFLGLISLLFNLSKVGSPAISLVEKNPVRLFLRIDSRLTKRPQ